MNILSTELTKDSYKLLCVLYKDYLEKIKQGHSKSDSSYFGNSDEISTKYFPDSHPEDISNSCWELYRSKYLSCLAGDDIAYEVVITSTGIALMENRFKNNIKEITNFITQFF